MALVSNVPLSGAHDRRAFHIQDRPLPSQSAAPAVDSYYVSADYFRTMGISLRRGRLLSEADMVPGSAPVAIIGEMTAREMCLNEDALRKQIQLGARNDAGPWATIVGVVGDVHQYGLDSAATADAYLPYLQNAPTFPTVLVRSRVPPNTLKRAIDEQVASLDKDVPVFAPATMDERIAESVAQRRFLTTLVSCFGGLALALASIGLYGVMTYQVAQRTNEIGLRMALGASPAVILRLVVQEGMFSVMLGISVGACIAAALVRVLASQLFGVKGYNPLVIGTAVGVLALCALLAAVVPARRAAAIDPIRALRTE